jgi:hypothetical protein
MGAALFVIGVIAVIGLIAAAANGGNGTGTSSSTSTKSAPRKRDEYDSDGNLIS